MPSHQNLFYLYQPYTKVFITFVVIRIGIQTIIENIKPLQQWQTNPKKVK